MIYSQDFLFIQIEGGASMHLAHVDEPAETPLAPARDSVEINPAQIVRVRVRVRKLYLTSDSVNSTTLALTWNEC